MTDSESEQSTSLIKRLVRTEVLTTVFVVFFVLFGYAYFFLDDHVEWGLEYLLGRSIGAEVNIGDLTTGWVTPKLTLHRFRITDPSEPARNIIELETLGVELSLDALLRLKYVINDASLEGLRTGTPRETPGWVSEEGGDLRWVYEKLIEVLKSRITQAADRSVFGDVGSLLSGQSPEAVLADQRENLQSTERLNQLDETLSRTESRLAEALEDLPDERRVEKLEQQIESLEGSSSGLRDLSKRLKTLREIRDTLEKWKSSLKSARTTVNQNLEELRTSSKAVESSLSGDLKYLRNRIQLPDVDLGNPSGAIFEAFVAERAGSIQTMLSYYEDYFAPDPNSATEASPTAEPESGTSGSTDRGTPAPGRDFQFQTRWSYPDFWLKDFRFSGSGNQPGATEVTARLQNLSSHPASVPGEMSLYMTVDRPTKNLDKIEAVLRQSRGSNGPTSRYRLSVFGLTIPSWELISSESVNLRLTGGKLMWDITGNYGSQTFDALVSARVENPTFQVGGSNEILTEVVRSSMTGIEHIELRGTGVSRDGTMKWRMESNLGQALEQGLKDYVSQKANVLKEKIVSNYRSTVQEEKEELLVKLEGLRQRYRGRLEDRSEALNRLEKELEELADKLTEKDGVRDLKSLFD